MSINPSDVFTAAQFDYKQLAVAVSMSGLEQLQNSGPDALLDLMESRIANAEKTMQNTLATDVYSDGTADGGKQIGGLQLLVSDAGTGTVGGINSSTWAFWKSQFYSFSTNSATASSTTIQSAMNQLYLNLSRGSDVPDLIVADATYFRYYLESRQAIQRITSSSEASAGYQSLKFMNADVVMDGGYFGSAPAAHMYMLNTDYIYYRPHRDRNMVTLGGGDRFSVNQDALVRLIGWAGNMTVSKPQPPGLHRRLTSRPDRAGGDPPRPVADLLTFGSIHPCPAPGSSPSRTSVIRTSTSPTPCSATPSGLSSGLAMSPMAPASSSTSRAQPARR